MAASTAKITGTAFFDLIPDGIQTVGEGSRGPGFIVNLVDATGGIVTTQATDAAGRYTFDNLTAGTYAVQFQASGGYRGNKGEKLVNGFDLIKDVKVVEGATVTLDEGFYQFNNDVSGFTFIDRNGNGRFDGSDKGANGVKIQLVDTGGKVAYETSTSRDDPAGLGFDGVYSFSNLKPGSYTVKMLAPDGNVSTGVNPYSVDLSPGQKVAGLLFSFRDVAAGSGGVVNPVSLSGNAFNDRNGNGVRDVGETGIAGASVILSDSKGYAISTTVADRDGHYDFVKVEAGDYNLTVATPQGLKGSGPTTVSSGTLSGGQSKAGLDVGFVADPITNKADAIPKAEVINVVLRGQSNTVYTTDYGFLPVLKDRIEKLLGFDGVNQKVNVMGEHDQPDGANTEWSATGLLKDWLSPVDGDYTKGWNATELELGLLSAIGKLPEEQRKAATAIVWLHNESDSFDADFTKNAWESGVRYEASLVRGILGQDASTVPYLFVNAIPFPTGGNPNQPAQNQGIRVGQTELTEDKGFNAAFVANQASDVTMNGDSPFTPGGAHMSRTDSLQLIERIAKGLAEQFKASALPDSPIALANGDIDDEGPKVVMAESIGGRPNQLLLTVAHDNADHLLSPNYTAGLGVGWSVRTAYDVLTPLAQGIKAEIVDKTHVMVTFDNAVPAGGKLFYAWGGDRIAINQSKINEGIGNGNALYDDNNMPIWADPRGVSITATVAVPSLKIAFDGQSADLGSLGTSGIIAVKDGLQGTIEFSGNPADGYDFDVAGAWNSVKTVVASSDKAQTLSLKDFVQVDVTLTNTSGDSSVNVDNLKRGTITTGGGNDAIDVTLLTNDTSSGVTVKSGAGNDTIVFFKGDQDNAGTGSGNWLVAAAATNNGVGVQDGSTTKVVIDAGSGNDTIDLSHVKLLKSVVTGGTGIDDMTASTGKDQFVFKAGDTGSTLATADVIEDFDARGGDTLALYGKASDWKAAFMADLNDTVVTNLIDGAKIVLEGFEVGSLKGWMTFA